MYITFYNIVTNNNEPPAAAQAHIHVATHKKIAIDGVAICSIGLHQVTYEGVASHLHVQFACAMLLSCHTIVTNNNEPMVAAWPLIHVATIWIAKDGVTL